MLVSSSSWFSRLFTLKVLTRVYYSPSPHVY
jgi:hypothetical protein